MQPIRRISFYELFFRRSPGKFSASDLWLILAASAAVSLAVLLTAAGLAIAFYR
ncbi:hypothetical protein ACFSM5_04775 [Lacibacterium aquatile]|uniref:Uncharacterized protein n=1 Tax=Lacibacterium aquatile TaxID=1168082 RepID=A0ABW5DRN8_9PROT